MGCEVTAHVMVRNEPLVHYAVKAIYPFVERILLYDTGSDDAHTLDDISRLVDEDSERKIIAKAVKIDVDETGWTESTWRAMQKRNKGKKTKGVVRAQMIKDTDTDWFLIVDGDEVHYHETLRDIRTFTRTTSRAIIAARIPLWWFCDMKHTFRFSTSGRVFRTAAVGMQTASPNEMHKNKTTNRVIHKGDPECADLQTRPYAHFETFVKPWRRRVPPEKVLQYNRSLPSVMREDMSFVTRFLKERKR